MTPSEVILILAVVLIAVYCVGWLAGYKFGRKEQLDGYRQMPPTLRRR
jgi:hypothetical protein